MNLKKPGDFVLASIQKVPQNNLIKYKYKDSFLFFQEILMARNFHKYTKITIYITDRNIKLSISFIHMLIINCSFLNYATYP